MGAYNKHEVEGPVSKKAFLKKKKINFHECMNVLYILLSLLSFHCVNWKECLESIMKAEEAGHRH